MKLEAAVDTSECYRQDLLIDTFSLSHLQTALQNSGIVPDVIDGVKLEEAVNHEDLA